MRCSRARKKQKEQKRKQKKIYTQSILRKK